MATVAEQQLNLGDGKLDVFDCGSDGDSGDGGYVSTTVVVSEHNAHR